jgi:hypothetical protein
MEGETMPNCHEQLKNAGARFTIKTGWPSAWFRDGVYLGESADKAWSVLQTLSTAACRACGVKGLELIDSDPEDGSRYGCRHCGAYEYREDD